MKVISNEKKEKSTVELVIEVEREEFEAAVESAYKKMRGKIQVPGFRKGKAPRKIIESMYGTGVFYEDAVNDSYAKAYDEAVAQEKLDVVGYPEVEIEKLDENGYTFKAVVAVKPEVKLGEYKGLSAVKETVRVTAKDIETEMQSFVDRASRMVAVDREAKMGDTAVIDYEGFKDGVAFAGGKGENYSLELGSGSFIPGFEEGVVGMKAGEEKDIDLTFPEEYHADELAGAAVVFHVKANEIKEKQLPEIDDEFAKDVSEFDTLEEFKADLKAKISERRNAEAKAAFENALMEQVVSNMEVEIPDAMVNVRVDDMIEDQARQVKNYGIEFEQYLQMMGMTMEAMKASARPTALRQVQVELALTAIVEAEGLTVAAEEIEAEYAALAAQYTMEVEKVKTFVPADALEHDLKMRKATEVIFSTAKSMTKTAAKKAAKTEE